MSWLGVDANLRIILPLFLSVLFCYSPLLLPILLIRFFSSLSAQLCFTYH